MVKKAIEWKSFKRKPLNQLSIVLSGPIVFTQNTQIIVQTDRFFCVSFSFSINYCVTFECNARTLCHKSSSLWAAKLKKKREFLFVFRDTWICFGINAYTSYKINK